jgi:hypothetical protein
LSPIGGWVGLFPTYNLCDKRAKLIKMVRKIIEVGYVLYNEFSNYPWQSYELLFSPLIEEMGPGFILSSHFLNKKFV